MTSSTQESRISENGVSRSDIEAFLFKEARLMDENRYDDWLSLWSEDALYWVPANADDYDPKFHVNLIYDDYSRLQDRIARLKSGAAWAQDPPSRMRRVLGNVEIIAVRDDGVDVICNFNLTELRRGKLDTFAGQASYGLRLEAGQLKIAHKKVILVNNDEVIDNLTFLL